MAALHTELREQEKVLAMFAQQRAAAAADKTKQESRMRALREEGADLRALIASRDARDSRREGLLARVQALEEIHDVCQALSAWRLGEMTGTVGTAGGFSLTYGHADGSTHTIGVRFAAKKPNIVCALTYAPAVGLVAKVAAARLGASGACASTGLLRQLVGILGPGWTRQVAGARTLAALQVVMQQIDVEMGRMQALNADLGAVLERFPVKGGEVRVQEAREEEEEEEEGNEEEEGTAAVQTCCSFTVGFVCVEPSVKWNVHFDIKRGYPFGWVEVRSETEIGSLDIDVTHIEDVAFGYGRLERACAHLQRIFDKQCAKAKRAQLTAMED